MAEQITVYATSWCGDCYRAKTFLDRHGVPYQWIDLEEAPGAVDKVLEINGGYRSVPTLVFPDGSTMTEPSNRELAEKLGIEAGAPPAR